MPQVYFRDNYSYQISGNNFYVFKYDILSNDYYKIEQFYLSTLPKKYSTILHDIQHVTTSTSTTTTVMDSIINQLKDIKVR